MKRLLFSLVILLVPVIGSAQTSDANELYQKGVSLLSESKYEQAGEVFRDALKLKSGAEKELKASIYLGLGISEFNLKQFELAEKSLKKSSKLRDGNHAETLYFQGVTAAALESESTAARMFNLAIAADPEHGESWYELGKLLLKQGNSSRAKIAFEMALKNGTEHEDDAKARLAQLSEGSQNDKVS